MTVTENLNPKDQYTGGYAIGETLPITFPYTEPEDVKCLFDLEQKTYNVDYSVFESTVTLLVEAPKDVVVTLYRDTPLDQQAEFPQNKKFLSEKMNEALDKACMQQQEQAEAINRSIKVPVTTFNFNGDLPNPIPRRSIIFNEDGTGLTLSTTDPDTFVIEANEAALAAKQSETNAKASETAAAQSAASALASQNAAEQAKTDTQAIADQALTDISSAKTDAIDAINVEEAEALANVADSTQLAKDWAIKMDGPVEANSYSSKYYAENAKALTAGSLNSTQITNCILEVPQRIKLEYENNVSGTLKAGSQVIIPSGFENDGVTPKFVYKEIEQDITFELTTTSSTSRVTGLWFRNGLIVSNVNRFSGDTAPTFIGAAVWYDTANNIIKQSTDSGATWNSGEFSLPIAKTNLNTEGMQITQIFNGMGYIGSTIWVNKGVKVLIPNGRNADGTLNNIEYVVPSDITADMNISYSGNMTLQLTNTGTISRRQSVQVFTVQKYEDLPTPATGLIVYCLVVERNKYYTTNNGSDYQEMQGVTFIADFVTNTTSITSLTPYQPVELLKRSDKAEITGWCFPSDRYDDLTLGASGQTYTAPADGWFDIVFRLNTNSQLNLRYTDNLLGTKEVATGSGQLLRLYLPVNKGRKVIVSWENLNSTTSDNYIHFVYAEGAWDD